MGVKVNSPDLPDALPRKDAAPAASRMTKWWLVLLTAAVGVSTILVVSSYRHAPLEVADDNPASEAAQRPRLLATKPFRAPSGPWGELECLPISLSPPLELIPEAAEGGSGKVAWHFPGTDSAGLATLFEKIGLSKSLRGTLVSMAKENREIDGSSIYPSRDFVLQLDPESRSALYVALAEHWENADQRSAFRFAADSTDAWFAASRISAETRELVAPLIYRYGNYLFFADLPSIRDALPSAGERLRLLATLGRCSTLLVYLEVSRDTDIASLVDYWGRGNRVREVRPILEAQRRAGGGKIDVTHLLPPFARRRLYTYPTPLAEADTLSRDCHWTSLNFFHEVPDDRLADTTYAVQKVKSEYDRFEGDPRLGDVIFLMNSREAVIHSAVFIAGGIVFHRTGRLPSEPWVLVKFADMLDYYPRHEKLDVHYYRRKGA